MAQECNPDRKARVIALAMLAETPEQAIELEQIASEMPVAIAPAAGDPRPA